MGDDDGAVFGRRGERAIALDDKVDGQTESGEALLAAAGDAAGVVGTSATATAGDGVGIVGDDGYVVPAAHELLHLAAGAGGIGVEDLHHVLLGVGDLVRRPVAVERDVQETVVVEHLEDVVARRLGHDGARDHLVHGLVVAGVRGVVDKPCTGTVDVYHKC